MDLFAVLLLLVVVNLVVGLVCGAAAPRPWAQGLAVFLLMVNAIPILLALVYVILMATGRMDGLAGLIIFPSLLLALEELWLLFICYRYYWRHPPAA